MHFPIQSTNHQQLSETAAYIGETDSAMVSRLYSGFLNTYRSRSNESVLGQMKVNRPQSEGYLHTVHDLK